MTAQIGDRYTFQDKTYTIVCMSNILEFEPIEYGLAPTPATTACWRGYWCHYHIKDEGIFLNRLYVYCNDEQYPEINGKGIVRDESGKPVEYMGFRVYQDLDMKMSHTGKILAGDGFVDDYYRYMGYQAYYAYEELKEFVFEQGNLVAVQDHSPLAARARDYIEEQVENNQAQTSWLLRGSGGYGQQFAEKQLTQEELQTYWWL